MSLLKYMNINSELDNICKVDDKGDRDSTGEVYYLDKVRVTVVDQVT